jgi:hypothetical protein
MRSITIRRTAVLAAAALTVFATGPWPGDAEAGRNVRNTTRTNVNANRNINRNVNRDFNANVDRNVNVDRDFHVDRDIDIDVDHHGGWGWGYHPVATAAAVTATAAVTAAAIGSIAYSLPPACAPVIMYGVTYQNCGGVWYQPQFAGTQVSYVIVNPPR